MPKPDSQMLLVSRQGDIQVIEFTATSLLDQVNIEKVGNEIESLVERSGHPKFVINFSNVHHVSSAMLGVLISVNKKIRDMKGELRLAAIPPSIMQVFELTRLDKLLKIYDSTSAAIKRF